MDALAEDNPLKQEFTALLEPGIKFMSLDMLKSLAVDPFPESTRRPVLFENLCAWMQRAVGLGMHGYMWLDGSFLTRKAEPNDIDCVVVIERFPAVADAQTVHDIQAHIDQRAIKVSYHLDMYPLNNLDPETARIYLPYWRGWFGYHRDGATAKGIARIEL